MVLIRDHGSPSVSKLVALNRIEMYYQFNKQGFCALFSNC